MNEYVPHYPGTHSVKKHYIQKTTEKDDYTGGLLVVKEEITERGRLILHSRFPIERNIPTGLKIGGYYSG